MMDRLTMPTEEIYDGCGFVHQRSVTETYPLHTHNFYEFFYIVSGRAIHNINGEKRLIQDGDLTLIRPDDIHSYEFINNWDIEIISTGFSREEFSAAIAYLDADERNIISRKFPLTVSFSGYSRNDIYRKLMEISHKEHGAERKTYFRRLLIEILYEFLMEEQEEGIIIPEHISEIVVEMRKKENYTAGLKRMLEISCISQEHLTREFRKYLNLTPTEFINLKRLDYVAQLLSQGEAEIIDVCFACGFNSVSHFYHKFKERFGCSPAKFAEKSNDRFLDK